MALREAVISLEAAVINLEEAVKEFKALRMKMYENFCAEEVDRINGALVKVREMRDKREPRWGS